MKLELELEDANSLGAVLVALRQSRWLDEKKEPLIGGDAILLYAHIDRVFKLRERILAAKKGGLKTAKKKSKKKPKKAPEMKKEVVPHGD